MTPQIEILVVAVLLAGLVLAIAKFVAGLWNAHRSRKQSGSDAVGASQLRPQTTSQRAARVQEEVSELIKSRPESANSGDQRSTGGNYLLAEELAIRAIEAEFGESIQRQVTLNHERGCDGYFTLDGDAQIVEVKYFTDSIDYQRIRNALGRARKLFVYQGLESARTICAIVAEDKAVGDLSKSRLEKLKTELDVNVVFRIYSFRALQEKFGAN